MVAEGEDTLCTRQGGAQAGGSPVKVGFCTTEDGHPGQDDGAGTCASGGYFLGGFFGDWLFAAVGFAVCVTHSEVSA